MKPMKLWYLSPSWIMTVSFLAAVIAPVSPTIAQLAEPIEFGVDGSWAYDGECDDRRFRGPGRSSVMDQAGLFQDAFDCRNAYKNRRVWLVSDALDMGFSDLHFEGEASPPDGMCSDPRFEGPGMSFELNEKKGLDSFDCQRAYLMGTIRLRWDSMLYGNDSGPNPHDGECNDPRFVTTSANYDKTVRSAYSTYSIGRDASDCRQLVEEGKVKRDEKLRATLQRYHFGDNSGYYAYDGECDDPRFEGAGMAEIPSRKSARKDAYDCANQFDMGLVSKLELTDPHDVIDIHNFGDNSSSFAFDNECDDPRFRGEGMAAFSEWSNVGRDAFDCSHAYKKKYVVKYNDWLEFHEMIIFKKHDVVEMWLTNDASLAHSTLETEWGDKISPLGLAALTPATNKQEVNALKEIIGLLIDHRADKKEMNDEGYTAFDMATRRGAHIDILHELLVDDAGQVLDNERYTPLQTMAAYVEDIEKLDIFKRSELRKKLAMEDRSALHVAAENNENPGVVDKLVQMGLNVNAKNKYGDTPLHLAVRSHNAQAVEELISAGAKLDIRGSTGKTPHKLAEELANPIIHEMLSDAGNSTLAEP